MTEDERTKLIEDITQTGLVFERVILALQKGEDDKATVNLQYACGLSMGLALRVGVRFGDDLEHWGEIARMRKAGDLSDDEWLKVSRAIFEREAFKPADEPWDGICIDPDPREFTKRWIPGRKK